MRPIVRAVSLAAALLAPAALAPVAQAQIRIQFQWGTRDRPLTGRRYEAMRALAHELDGRAQHAVDEVTASGIRSRRDRNLYAAVNDFAQRAADFHERMDNYADRPWDLPPEVTDLRARAYRVNESFRRVATFEHVVDDWNAALEVLNQMQLVLQGGDVPVIQPHRWDRDRDYDEHEHEYQRYQGGYGHDSRGYAEGGNAAFGYGGGARYADPQAAQEFRSLADQLVDEASRARQEAGHWEDPFGDGHARDLGHFVDLARQLRQAANDTDRVDPNRVRPLLDHIASDARKADQHIRSTRGLEGVRDDWSRIEQLVGRMDQLTR